MNIKTTLILGCTLAVFSHAFAAAMIDAKKSTVTITAKQMNVPMNAKFNKVSGTVDYNPGAPDATKATIDIDIASFDLGDPDYNKEVLKKEWFNAAQFPKASFISTSIKSGANGVLTASGKLTIKGKALDVTFPVKINKDATATVFEGAIPIHRLAYNIGEGEWSDTGMVADEVVIRFHVVIQ